MLGMVAEKYFYFNPRAYVRHDAIMLLSSALTHISIHVPT